MANYVYGTNGNDNLNGAPNADDWIFGFGGHDVITGGNGNDWLFGHDGNAEVQIILVGLYDLEAGDFLL